MELFSSKANGNGHLWLSLKVQLANDQPLRDLQTNLCDHVGEHVSQLANYHEFASLPLLPCGAPAHRGEFSVNLPGGTSTRALLTV